MGVERKVEHAYRQKLFPGRYRQPGATEVDDRGGGAGSSRCTAAIVDRERTTSANRL